MGIFKAITQPFVKAAEVVVAVPKAAVSLVKGENVKTVGETLVGDTAGKMIESMQSTNVFAQAQTATDGKFSNVAGKIPLIGSALGNYAQYGQNLSNGDFTEKNITNYGVASGKVAALAYIGGAGYTAAAGSVAASGGVSALGTRVTDSAISQVGDMASDQAETTFQDWFNDMMGGGPVAGRNPASVESEGFQFNSISPFVYVAVGIAAIYLIKRRKK